METEGKVDYDSVERPNHYNQGNVECIDAIESAVATLSGYEGYLIGNAIKYLWRWKIKNGKEDLLKARWHLEKLIQKLEGGDDVL